MSRAETSQHPLVTKLFELLTHEPGRKNLLFSGSLDPLVAEARAITDNAELTLLVRELCALGYALDTDLQSPAAANAVIAFLTSLAPALIPSFGGPQGERWTKVREQLKKLEDSGSFRMEKGLRERRITGVGLRRPTGKPTP